MSDALSRRPALLAALIGASVLALLLALAVNASAQDDDPSEEPTEEATATEDADEDADEPGDDATDEPAEEDDALVQGLAALLADEDVESDALYQAFVQFLVSEYDTTVELDDDVLSIQIDLEQLGR